MNWLKKLVLISALLFSLVSCGDPEEQFEIIKGYVPQAIEIFEQSKEHFDILRDGAFAENEAAARLDDEGLYLSGRMGRIRYEDWHTIDWLSEEEKNAILFLMHSDELQINFTWVAVVHTFESQSMSAELTTYRRGRVAIHHGDGGFVSHQSYTVDLGDGYTLWAYIMAGG